MTKLLPALAALAALSFSSPAWAKDDTQYWQTLNLSVSLPDDFKLSNEAVFRTSDAKGFYEIENSVMVGKKLNKQVTAWLGYTFNPQYSHGDFTVREHRFRQQVNIDNFAKAGNVKFSGRVRLEERWREGADGTGWRLRPQVKASMPLVGKTTLSLSNETFVNLNTTRFQKVDGLDRMRNAVMVGIPLGKRFSLDAGYLNQHHFVRHGPDNDDHVLNLQLNASF